MSLLLIDLAYLGAKGAVSLSWFLAKNSYNLVAYGFGAEPIQDTPDTSETQQLLQEIRGLRDEVTQLKSQMEYINDQTYQLVDPNCLTSGDDEVTVHDTDAEALTKVNDDKGLSPGDNDQTEER